MFLSFLSLQVLTAGKRSEMTRSLEKDKYCVSENGHKKILVVDDEADMRTFVSTVLEINGHQPLVAQDGEKALEIARREVPDLVILDVMMPEIEDGINTYRRIRCHDDLKHIPILMLSAIARKTFFHAISRLHLETGASLPEPDAYMEKPPDASELALLISALLKKALTTVPD